MKTVSLGFDEYMAELKAEREAGFNLARGLKEKLSDLMRSFDSRDWEKTDRAAANLYQTLRELEKTAFHVGDEK